jgi:hypothetical protein
MRIPVRTLVRIPVRILVRIPVRTLVRIPVRILVRIPSRCLKSVGNFFFLGISYYQTSGCISYLFSILGIGRAFVGILGTAR